MGKYLHVTITNVSVHSNFTDHRLKLLIARFVAGPPVFILMATMSSLICLPFSIREIGNFTKTPNHCFAILVNNLLELSPNHESIFKLLAMDVLVMVKEEAEETDDQPHPIAGLNDSGPPPFLMKIFEMVEDPETDTMVSWSTAENSLIVWDSGKFSTTLLPKYFKHSNFSSFIRQLNTYGFRKVDPYRWEFANEKFLRGQKHLLNEIKRRRNVGQTSQHQNPSGARFDQWSQVTGTPCVEAEQFGVEFEVNRLRRDRKTFNAEIAKLREQHQNSQAQLMAMEERIEGSERMQKSTLSFMARALKNPFFIQQLVLKSRSKKKRSETLQTAEELQIVLEMETLLGSENESGCCSAEEGGAEFETCGEEMREMSNVIWELMNNEGLESTRAGGPETNIKAEKFEKGSGHWIDMTQDFGQDFT